jgi:hypothetical protein
VNATLRRTRLRLFAIAALGVFSLSLLPLQLIGLFFVPQTTFGIQVDDQTLLITVDDPRVTKEGVHDGDQLDVARMSYDDRVALFSNMTAPANWQAGRAIVVSVKSARFGSRTTRLKAFPESSPQPFEFRLAQWTDALIGVLWVLIGAVLVAVRPSAMTWGFYLFCLGLHPFSSLGDWLGPPWLTALLIVGFCVIRALAYAGIIFFAARAPRGSAEGGWKYFELAALPLFLSLVVIYCYDSLPDVTGVPDRLDLTSLTVGIVYGIKAAVLIALFVKMIRSRGAERASMAWVFAGYAAFTAAIATWNFVLPHAGAGTFLHDAVFTFNTFGLAALPFFVAYAVVWHRAFGMGFITNRVLVYGFFIATLGMFFGIIDWLVSAELAFRSLGIGIALGAAFAAGLVMQSQYRRAIQLVDRIFLPQRYAAGVQLDRIREALRSGARHTDERFASDVADALGLASVAVFGRTGDGGFVREVSCGWSDADAWHVLPGDVLCRKLTRRPGLVRLTESDAGGIALPAATARPQMAIAVRRRGRIERAILIGSRRSGASLDGDEVRGLAAVFAGAAA